MRPLTILAVALLITGCAFSPPPPAACKDDGRGMFPINPEMITPEQMSEGRTATTRFNVETFNVEP